MGMGPQGRPRETTDVGRYPANSWGLHDMHGNVWEWCADHWHDNYTTAPEDGRPWLDEKADKGGSRLLRGGSWNHDPRYCRSAYRNRNHPDDRNTTSVSASVASPRTLLLYTYTLELFTLDCVPIACTKSECCFCVGRRRRPRFFAP